MPISSSASFTGYTEGGFDYNEQLRLKNNCDKLASQGIKFLDSNSDCEEIRELYKDYKIMKTQFQGRMFTCMHVELFSSIHAFMLSCLHAYNKHI